VAYSEQQLSLFEECEYARGGGILGSLSGRTSQVLFHPTGGWIFKPCSKKSEKVKFQCLKVIDGLPLDWCNARGLKSHGGYWTHNIGEYPNEESESSLSRILQPMEDVPEKYYLSPRACRGILRRAQERGKKLPEELRIALERQAVYMDLTHGQV
jgi:hypothetical protein